MEAWLTKPDRTPEHDAFPTSDRSRSDKVKVAVGFSPRNAAVLGPRRVATLEKSAPQFMRRSATRLFSISHRGLKPTATVGASLRDAGLAVSFREQSQRDCITKPRVAPQRGCSLLVARWFRWKQRMKGRRAPAPQGPMKVAGGKPQPQGEAHPPGQRSPAHRAPAGRMNRRIFPPCAPPGRRSFSNLHRWVRAAERRFPPATFIGASGTSANRDNLHTRNSGLADGIPLGFSGSCPFVSISG